MTGGQIRPNDGAGRPAAMFSVRVYENLVDNFHRAWSTSSTQETEDQLETCCSPDVAYSNPWWQSAGRRELATSISQLVTRFPHHDLHRLSDLDVHHGQALLTWAMRDSTGTPALFGTEVIEFSAELLICRAVAFFGQLRPRTKTYSFVPPAAAAGDEGRDANDA